MIITIAPGFSTKQIKICCLRQAFVEVLKASGVKKSYGDFAALKGIDVSLTDGRCLGLIGPNGAGKSTFMRIVVGVLTKFEGDVHVFGYDVRRHAKRIKRRIGYLPEEPSLYPRQTARHLLKYFARLYGYRGDIDQRVTEVLSLVGLEERAESRVETFSKGMRQRLAVARALVHDPELLVLDEPTMGLDPGTADRIRQFVWEQRSSGRTILLSTHYMEEAERLCDSVVIIDSGRAIASGDIDQVRLLATGGEPLVRVILEETVPEESLSEFEWYRYIPRGVIVKGELERVFDALREAGIVRIEKALPSLKETFIALTEAEG